MEQEKSKILYQTQYPNSHYFDFWTVDENYLVNDLVQKNKSFALAVNFNNNIVEKYVYEYDPMLNEMLQLSNNYTSGEMKYFTHCLVKFDINKQYVVIVQDLNYNAFVLGQYDSSIIAADEIRNDAYLRFQHRLNNEKFHNDMPHYAFYNEVSHDLSHDLSRDLSHDDFYYKYVIVNLETTRPYFLNSDKPQHDSAKKPGIYFTYTSENILLSNIII